MSDGGEGWQFPLEELYTAFGDESINGAGAFYGLVLVPRHLVSAVATAIAQIKARYHVDARAEIHCHKLFHPIERARSPFSHLDDGAVLALLRDVFKTLNLFQPKYMVAMAPREFFPKQFRLLGKNGAPGYTHPIDQHWITLNLYQGLAGMLDPETIDPPPDYKTAPRPRSEPFWQVIVKREGQGPRVNCIHLDRARHKLRWFSKNLQWATVAKDLVVQTPRGSSFLPVQVADDQKHPLLEIADAFVYLQGRALGGREVDLGELISDDVFLQIVGERCDEVVRGMPEDVAAYHATKRST
jgi:hypothetical protein